MSEVNSVELRGQLAIHGSGRSKASDMAWARGKIRVGKQWISVKAFKEAAEELGNAADLTVTIHGHLEGDKPKDPAEKNWPLVVVVDRVQVHPPGERKGNAPKAQTDEMPF